MDSIIIDDKPEYKTEDNVEHKPQDNIDEIYKENKTDDEDSDNSVKSYRYKKTNVYKRFHMQLQNKKKKEIQIPDTNLIIGKESGFNRYSPFISMMIEKRLRSDEKKPLHIASILPSLAEANKNSTWAFGKIAFGENSSRSRFGNSRLSTHAEMNALEKFNNLIRVKRCKTQKMDLVVIRINKNGNLCDSMPCFHCTMELMNSKTLTLDKLYFSRFDGSITCIKFTEWIKNEKFHISKGWRRLMSCQI
jgi:hypothetical protein